MKEKAFAYLRCSGQSQIDGDSFDRQRAAISAFAKAHRLKIEREFIDAGVSGTLVDRPALKELFIALNSNGVKKVILSDCTRLARRLIAQETILDEFRKGGFTVLDASGTDLTAGDDDPTKTLIRQVLGAVSEWNKTELVQKLRAAKLRIKKADPSRRVDGRKPYSDPALLKRIVELRRKRKGQKPTSYAQIANLLNEEGFPTKSGKKFYASTVRNIYERRNALK
jgi:DNA invertase Pin-like site-specific DNA recombinase